MTIKKASTSSISSGTKGLSMYNQIVATGGNEVRVVGNYKYHIFSTIGGNTFNVKSGNAKIDVLCIGGGGGGGYRAAGGGGAGSLSLFTSVDVSNGNYTCYVGAGGAAGTNANVYNGQNSFFSKNNIKFVKAPGGGGGGSASNGDGYTGGSGGGGGEWSVTGTGGRLGQDYGALTRKGGNGIAGPYYAGGGGGGALSVGTPSTNYNGGAGGTGYTLSSIDTNLTSANFNALSGMTTVCSGGGGGSYYQGVGGTGGTGAGNGGTTSTPGASASSFGSGGGGGGGDSGGAVPGTGYQGLVIIRYPIDNPTLNSFVSSGLVLNLDASNSSSYSGSGTLWNDLSGNGNHVTMQNSGSITYNSSSYFSTGSNGYFSRTGSTTLGTGNPSYTMIVWARKPSTWGDSGLITISDSFTTNETNAFRTRSVGGETNRLGLGSFTNFWWSNDLPYEGLNSADLELNKWFMATTTYDSSTNIRKLFGNNICLIQDTPLGGHNMTNTNLLIGKTSGTEYLAGDISLVLVYNRGLSSSEVTEIFNYYKPRFGI
jgi:hypothetical protein